MIRFPHPKLIRTSEWVRLVIALVWLGNGLFCKLLHLVPRHEAIVARILGEAWAAPLTRIIGLLEILMAVWVASGLWPRWSALLQMGIIVTMNILEFLIAPDLLLWGRLNMVFALMLVAVIAGNEFVLRRQERDRELAE